ncbi:MAG: hypothetical protein JNK99_16335 [Candidatus Accumulibacter sp.]|uniref:hypothetical protein n=1 Tax=Accumulibacter sp. TaxID=2053492 RepID=UPI001A5574B4|nr:hypothetical protein [Accumulibacter sp.]MBL8396289.1 hypothetical protein [Accumulibacter sp.]
MSLEASGEQAVARLNRVEKLWRKMKYEGMTCKARSSAVLEADVDQILAGFSSEYRMTFC